VNYPPPVDQLLSLEAPKAFVKDWPDYRQLGLTSEHVPDLIRMSVDQTLHQSDGDSLEVWAPVHAWRALGQLGATSAALPLLELLNDADGDDWIHEELPVVLAMIGPAILPELIRFLDDAGRYVWGRIMVVRTLRDVAMAETGQREEVVTALSRALSNWRENETELNAFIISYLADLEAVEAAPLMEEAFSGQQVDIGIDGDWEDIQIRLGLLTERITPPPRYNHWPGLFTETTSGDTRTAPKAKKSNSKEKRKAAKAARKRNRRRK
jgi:hypothetical protein